MHPLDCSCPSCVTRPGPVMGVVVPAPAPDASTSEWVAHWRAETAKQLAEMAAGELRHPSARPRVVEVCGCDESDWYRKMLERAMVWLPLVEAGPLRAEILAALALRGDR